MRSSPVSGTSSCLEQLIVHGAALRLDGLRGVLLLCAHARVCVGVTGAGLACACVCGVLCVHACLLRCVELRVAFCLASPIADTDSWYVVGVVGFVSLAAVGCVCLAPYVYVYIPSRVSPLSKPRVESFLRLSPLSLSPALQSQSRRATARPGLPGSGGAL